MAMLSKLVWRVKTKSNPLWTQTLNAKYLKGHPLNVYKSKKPAFHIWKGIVKTMDFINENTKSIVGEGNLIFGTTGGLWISHWKVLN